MKKTLFIFLLLIFISGVNAQELKLIGGPIISNYTNRWPPSGDDIWIFNSSLNPFRNHKTGFIAGFGTEFVLNKNIALELDALFFQKGSTFVRYTWYLPKKIGKEIYNMSGLSFPVLVKMRFLPRPFPYILGGGKLSFLLSHRRKNKMWGGFGYRETQDNLIENTKKIDYGLVLGCGFEIKISKVFFLIEGRYNLGLRNLFPKWDEPSPYLPHVDIKTRALEILCAFKI